MKKTFTKLNSKGRVCGLTINEEDTKYIEVKTTPMLSRKAKVKVYGTTGKPTVLYRP